MPLPFPKGFATRAVRPHKYFIVGRYLLVVWQRHRFHLGEIPHKVLNPKLENCG
jgi:hypothetical protein